MRENLAILYIVSQQKGQLIFNRIKQRINDRLQNFHQDIRQLVKGS